MQQTKHKKHIANHLFLMVCILVYGMLISPANAQSDNQTQKKADSLFSDYLDKQGPGFSMMVIKADKPVFTYNSGLANVREKSKITSNTNYNLVSLSAQFTAMAIMVLKEQGKLNYGDKISDIIPDFPEYGKHISIKNLLHHTSGIINVKMEKLQDEKGIITNEGLIDFLKNTDSTKFKSGKKLDINWVNYALLGYVIMEVSGKKYAEFIDKEIFTPLKMDDAAVFPGEKQGFFKRLFGKNTYQIKHKATGYIPQNGRYNAVEIPHEYDLMGDFGVYCSLNDLYKWLQAWQSDNLIPQNSIKPAFKINFFRNVIKFFGFGWNIDWYQGRKYYHKAGTGFGNTHFICHLPQHNISVIVLSNQSGVFGIKDKALALAEMFMEKK
jgi:CubicO group peptidase (beta-lactamase class C family)